MRHIDDAPTFSAADVLEVLHRSHERLTGTLAGLGPEAVTQRSYHSWTIAEVASHLGSGAEISRLRLEAVLHSTPQPGAEEAQAVWDRWNAKSPADQAADTVVADREFLDAIDALTPAEGEAFEADLFGSRYDLAGFLRMRLAEHALHTWDITVALDPASQVGEDAVRIVVDNLGATVGWAAQYVGEPRTVDVRLSDPTRHLWLELSSDGSRLTAMVADDEAATDGALTMPAEAFVRLVYGRLDAEHTPQGVISSGIELETLRRAFPGL